MNKIFISILGILILIILLITVSFNFKKDKPFITINNKTFVVDVAKTDSEREKGLAIYKSLPENKGMIFIFSKSGNYPFWMKDMKFPIDIIYIKDNKIVDIFENVLPPKSSNDQLEVVSPKETADKVLEINANLSKKYNFKKGDLVNINI
jgi:uncharacterized membrane protein (UPF0127 family)